MFLSQIIVGVNYGLSTGTFRGLAWMKPCKPIGDRRCTHFRAKLWIRLARTVDNPMPVLFNGSALWSITYYGSP